MNWLAEMASDSSLNSGEVSEVVVWAHPIKDSNKTFLCVVDKSLLGADNKFEHPLHGVCLYWRLEL